MLDFWFYIRAARDVVILVAGLWLLFALFNEGRQARRWRKGRG
jgi:hypothetical protein